MGCGTSAPAAQPAASPKPKPSAPSPAASPPAVQARAAEPVPAATPPPAAAPKTGTGVGPESPTRHEKKEEIESTLAMIKPDAVSAGAALMIKQAIVHKGFEIVQERCYKLSEEQAGEFYAEHKGKPFYDTLVSFMTSGEIYALELRKEGAIKAWRAMMGPTNSDKAKAEAPESLRAQFGTDGTKNATHGSDSPASAAREIAFHFPADWDKVTPEKSPEPAGADAKVMVSAAGDEGIEIAEAQPAASYRLGDEDQVQETPKETPAEVPSGEPAEEEDMEIDVNDAEQQQAAIKLQSGFRGYQARKDVQKKRAEGAGHVAAESAEATQEAPVEEPAAAEEVGVPASELVEVPVSEVTPALDSPPTNDDAAEQAPADEVDGEDIPDAAVDEVEEVEDHGEEVGDTIAVEEAVDDIVDKTEEGDTLHGGVAAETG